MNKKKITISLLMLALFAGAGMWPNNPALMERLTGTKRGAILNPSLSAQDLDISRFIKKREIKQGVNGQTQRITVAGKYPKFFMKAATYKIYITYQEDCDCPSPKKIEKEVGILPNPDYNIGEFTFVKDLPVLVTPPAKVILVGSIKSKSTTMRFDLGEAKFID